MAQNLCLVTGVAGFIGSHLAEKLIARGHFVVGVDSFSDYYPRAIKQHNLTNLVGHARFALVEANLVDLDLAALLRDPATCSSSPVAKGLDRRVDKVFHLAAQPGVRASWGASFDIYIRANILATQRLLEAAKEVGVQKLVYASSSSIYGDAESLPTREDVRPQPVSPYGVTKLAGEHLCLLYSRNHGVPVVCLRFFTVYGPRQRPDMAFHRFIRSILNDEEISVYGDGEQTRDFTFVADTVEGTCNAGFSDVVGEAINLGGGSRVTVNHVVGLLEEIIGKAARVRYLAAQHGDVRDTSADLTRARHMLAYQPRFALADGLREEVSWMKG